MNQQPSISVLLPCFNEEVAIAGVIRSFRLSLPEARIFVCDNNSTDNTANIAKAAGAEVIFEPLQGKGNSVRRLFADIEADIYILADGDGTYDASHAPQLIDELVSNNLDMVAASRVSRGEIDTYRAGHQFGNKLISRIIARLFGNQFKDVLTGYRVFSRRFIKSFPALSSGFEIETEIVIHALELRIPTSEVDTDYQARPKGSTSKLSTYKDGMRILLTIIQLFKEVRPLLFFTAIFSVLSLTSIALAWPILMTYFETGFVPRFPTAILSTGLMILAFISLTCGIILDSVTRARCELRRLFYNNSLPRS